MAWRVGGPGGAGWGNRVPPERACPRLAKGPQVPSSPRSEPRDSRRERPTPMVHGEKKERGWGLALGGSGREQTLSLMAASASPAQTLPGSGAVTTWDGSSWSPGDSLEEVRPPPGPRTTGTLSSPETWQRSGAHTALRAPALPSAQGAPATRGIRSYRLSGRSRSWCQNARAEEGRPADPPSVGASEPALHLSTKHIHSACPLCLSPCLSVPGVILSPAPPPHPNLNPLLFVPSEA